MVYIMLWFVTHMTTLIILLLDPDIKKRGILCNNIGGAGWVDRKVLSGTY